MLKPNYINMQVFCSNEQQINDFARELAKYCVAGTIFFLKGDLGAGKTTLVRCLLNLLKVSDKVKSPTFTLVEEYPHNNLTYYHFDLYRLASPEELEFLGFRDYINTNSICFIEWPEKAEGFLPEPDVVINFDILDKGRLLTLTVNN